jgi:hypothetical protein
MMRLNGLIIYSNVWPQPSSALDLRIASIV